MSIETIVLYVLLPILLMLLQYIRKSDMERLSKLEQKVDKSITDVEVRQVMQDKLDPIVDNIAEIKRQLDKVVDHIIDLKK